MSKIILVLYLLIHIYINKYPDCNEIAMLQLILILVICNCYLLSKGIVDAYTNRMVSTSRRSLGSFQIFAAKDFFKSTLTKLVNRENLSKDEAQEALDKILASQTSSESSSPVDPITVGAFLSLLRAKGESPQEVAGLAESMQKVCKSVKITGKLLDIVGTGGDGADTINISTASVILSAACGCKVAKAGNRSVSSRCGSADVLETLGVIIEQSPEEVRLSPCP